MRRFDHKKMCESIDSVALSGRISGDANPGLKAWAKLCSRFVARRLAPKNVQTPDPGLKHWAILFRHFMAVYAHSNIELAVMGLKRRAHSFRPFGTGNRQYRISSITY